MSCLHCNSKFGLFNRQSGCGSCGLSLCHKCLKHKSKVSNNGKEVPVCLTCYNTLSKKSSIETKPRPPPDVFIKRMANSEGGSSKTEPSLVDQNLISRLKALKDDKNLPPSEQELQDRLHKLKGETAKTAIVYDPTAVDLRSDQEKIDSLLEEYASEAGIQKKNKCVEDLEERIAKLKDERVIKQKQNLDNKDLESSDEETEKVAEKIMSAVALEDKRKKIIGKDEMAQFEDELEDDEPELPWCVLCNNDAQFRCLDCKDLYCKRCCNEAHKEWGENDHNIIKYEKK